MNALFLYFNCNLIVPKSIRINTGRPYISQFIAAAIAKISQGYQILYFTTLTVIVIDKYKRALFR